MTAKDLLYKILDYQCIWGKPHNIDEKPSTVRLAQIESLLDAFGLSKKYVSSLVQGKYRIGKDGTGLTRAQYLNTITNLEYLLLGEFIRDRPYELNEELTTKALYEIISNQTHLESYGERPVDLSWMFNDLIQFRQQIYNVAYPNGGMLEGFSVGLYYSHFLQMGLKKIINENLNDIDETLWLILDPSKRDFSLEELVGKYNYQEVDLDKIDRDWRIENY